MKHGEMETICDIWSTKVEKLFEELAREGHIKDDLSTIYRWQHGVETIGETVVMDLPGEIEDIDPTKDQVNTHLGVH